MSDSDLIRLTDAARLVDVRPSTLLERVDAGELEAFNRDGEIHVRRADVAGEKVPGGS